MILILAALCKLLLNRKKFGYLIVYIIYKYVNLDLTPKQNILCYFYDDREYDVTSYFFFFVQLGILIIHTSNCFQKQLHFSISEERILALK